MKTKTERKEHARNRKKFDRWLLALDRERRELREVQREAPLVKLDEPYQKGWEREFILTKQAQQRKDAEDLQAALSYLRNYERCAVNPFRKRHFLAQKRKPWPHHLDNLSYAKMLKLKVPEHLMKYFQMRQNDPLTRARLRELLQSRWKGNFWFRYPEYVRSEVRPYYITHSRVALPEVDRRLDEIDGFLERSGYQNRLWRLKDQTWQYDADEPFRRALRKCSQEEIAAAMLSFDVGQDSSRDRPLGFSRFVGKIEEAVLAFALFGREFSPAQFAGYSTNLSLPLFR